MIKNINKTKRVLFEKIKKYQQKPSQEHQEEKRDDPNKHSKKVKEEKLQPIAQKCKKNKTKKPRDYYEQLYATNCTTQKKQTTF